MDVNFLEECSVNVSMRMLFARTNFGTKYHFYTYSWEEK